MKGWKKGEFLFCFVIIWAAALLQGYGLYQEWREERETIDAFKLLDVSEMEGYVRVVPVYKENQKDTATDRGTTFSFLCHSIENVDELIQYKAKAERSLRKQNLDYKTNLTLKGSRSGRMSLDEKAEVTDRLFHSLKAKEVEGVKEEELYTVYGFSPLLNHFVSYGENEINLNLVFSYDEGAGKTVFYLAMPYMEEEF